MTKIGWFLVDDNNYLGVKKLKPRLSFPNNKTLTKRVSEQYQEKGKLRKIDDGIAVIVLYSLALWGVSSGSEGSAL